MSSGSVRSRAGVIGFPIGPEGLAWVDFPSSNLKDANIAFISNTSSTGTFLTGAVRSSMNFRIEPITKG